MSKTDLTWLKTLIENYKTKNQIEIDSEDWEGFMKDLFKAKIEAADEILHDIKIFIKEANKLTEK